MNKNIKIAYSLIIMLLLISGCARSSSENEDYHKELVHEDTLTIGVEGTYRPYSYIEKGKLSGFEVELGTDIASELGLKAEFVTTKWDSLIAGLDVNRYDLVLNNVVKNKMREHAFDFTVPYMQGTTMLAVKKGSSIKSIKQIKDKKMAESITSNNSQDAIKLGAKVVPADNIQQAVDLVNEGRADGTLNTKAAFSVLMKEQPDTNIELISAGNTIKPYPVSGVLSKHDPALTKRINQAIRKLNENGTIRKLSYKYFDADVTK